MKASNYVSITYALAVSFTLVFAGPVAAFVASPATVNLGSAGNYVILAKTGISTTGSTFVVGNIGVSPAAATSITGFALELREANTFSTSAYVSGKVLAASYADPTPASLTTAVNDMESAYTDAAGRTNPTATELGAGNIGGMTLSPGLYKWGTGVTIPADVTLSGSANDIWIFQIAGTLDISSGKKVILAGGARASNIFWVVAGQTTIGTTAVFNGNILDQTAIVLNTGAKLNGRALAQTAVTLDSNIVKTIQLPPPLPSTLLPPSASTTITSSTPQNSAPPKLTPATVQGCSSDASFSTVNQGNCGNTYGTTTSTTSVPPWTGSGLSAQTSSDARYSDLLAKFNRLSRFLQSLLQARQLGLPVPAFVTMPDLGQPAVPAVSDDMSSLDSARKKGRDAKRVSDIGNISVALEMYYDTNKSYPFKLTGLVAPRLLPFIPTDPSAIGACKTGAEPSCYSYAVLGSGTDCSSYHLGATLELRNDNYLSRDADAEAAGLAGECAGSAEDFSGADTGKCKASDTGIACYDLKPASSPIDTLSWKTYTNAKYGFEIKYPTSNWRVEMPAHGEATIATNQAEAFTIRKLDSTDSIFFNITTLGSDRLGSNYASAKNIAEYLTLLAKKDQNGKVIRKFVQMVTIAGQQAYWYQTYEWSVAKQAYAWSSQVYWQHGNDIYEVRIDPLANDVSNQILSTFKFTSVSTNQVATKASITVLSPNGGEVYKAGSPMTIRWKATGLSSNVINITLSRVEETQTPNIARNIQNTGSYTWTIPQNLGKGSFTVRVSTPDANGEDNIENKNADYSDNFFTINSAVTSVDTSNWKTYTNTKYGFEFQYPTTAEVEIGGYGGGGILNPGQVNFSISFTDHPQDGPGSNGFENIHFNVQPISNLKDKTVDGLYQSYVKSLDGSGYTVQKFTVGDDSGVLYFPPVVSRPGSGCGAHIDLLHGSYVFSLPSQFGTIFAPQTKIGDCTKNNITVSDDYLKTLSTFKFIK